jgi:hypothetical protein
MLGSVPIELNNSDGKSECRDTKTGWIKLNVHVDFMVDTRGSIGDALDGFERLGLCSSDDV